VLRLPSPTAGLRLLCAWLRLSAADAEVGHGFAVEYEHRSTDKFDRKAVIDAFVDHIQTPPHKVGFRV
jgi:hypothetical protein